ncbi:MAG: NUDIX domain-containing protein [Candidatus Saccharimonas sp.]
MFSLTSLSIQKKFKKVNFEEEVQGKLVNFSLLRSANFVPNPITVTSVAVVPFVLKTEIITVRLDRGIDIPGGHTEESDIDLVATVEREVREETGIELVQPIYLIGIIKSDYLGTSPSDATYMLITAAKVAKISEYLPQLESRGREQLDIDAFLARYSAGSRDMMAEIVNRAKETSGELFQRSR